MLKEVNWSVSRTYRSETECEPYQFYSDALIQSKSLDLLLGYFSSATISVLSGGFAVFLSSGGIARIVINDVLSDQDKHAIKQATQREAALFPIDLLNVKGLRKTLDDYGRHFFECLSWLIANQRIQMKIIRPKNRRGISHYKSGIFSDGIEQVGFKGSCNFTAYGLLENLEEMDVYLSWENGRSSQWINNQAEYFQKIFSGDADFVEYLDVNAVTVAIQKEFGDKTIGELLIEERELLERKRKFFENPLLQRTFDKVNAKLEYIIREPRFPYLDGPRAYQIEAYERWRKKGTKGIFAMATGTGKTITSLNCILQEFKKNSSHTYHALILVPTITLVDQWVKEVRSFNFQEVFKVSSKNDWQNELTTLVSTSKRISLSFIIVSTYASFVKDKFRRLVNDLPEDTIFIADEGHNLASPIVAEKLKGFKLQKRIGLSATPKRIYDPEGTQGMERFFDDREPYTFSFPMEQAIKQGVLCSYYYFPHIIRLAPDELSRYIEISNRLAKLSRFKRSPENDIIIERLLLTRKRIIHKATHKLPTTIDILTHQFQERGNLKYTFVYVPEGESFEIREEADELVADNIKLINQYTREIAKIDDNILVNQFISGMKDRQEILDQFQSGVIDVIASMKCLDEGVDIPRAEVAIFCSSTGNPRQFVQRRGRILRNHPEKDHAVIHDLVVIPDYTERNLDADTYALEKGLVKAELERVMHFASLSRNPYNAEDVFKSVCDYYDLNVYSIQNELSAV
ncbi:DEAD/DEAH box helicase family protein [Chryseolinea soli]|uniref:DEAD/DEAH box helicase n=1 Tax=Chryseolinea soli TaxID=2321403 RepID=A0A385SMC0_9BACT|nr:DEAD/DEAH box helicase family protein [Chryseolinea soli]AYB31982.1 DEAD/DEAH box helicase [Chryseolinea soli]